MDRHQGWRSHRRVRRAADRRGRLLVDLQVAGRSTRPATTSACSPCRPRTPTRDHGLGLGPGDRPLTRRRWWWFRPPGATARVSGRTPEIGMLIGIAAPSVRGCTASTSIYRAQASGPGAGSLTGTPAAEAARYREAYVPGMARSSAITAIVCLVGRLLGLLISGRTEHADEPGSAEPDDAPTAAIDVRRGRSTRRHRRSPRAARHQTRIQRATAWPSPASLTPSAAPMPGRMSTGCNAPRSARPAGAAARHIRALRRRHGGLSQSCIPVTLFVLFNQFSASAADDGPVWYEVTGRMVARIGCSPLGMRERQQPAGEIHVNDTGRQQNCIPGRA